MTGTRGIGVLLLFSAGKLKMARLRFITIVETFSILTGRRGWRASEASEVLNANTGLLKKISLTGSDYLQTCARAEGLGIRGGAIYDALILCCARKAGAAHIWTLNARHFVLFAPELKDVIREPL